MDLSEDQQMLTLRDLTRRTGIMHEAQMIVLKNWAVLASPVGATDVKFEPNIEVKRICFVFTSEHDMDPEMKGGLERSVEWLLGPDWSVTVRRERVR